MRHCVLRHHVCLCVLSTAMLAGFALLIDPKKGYAAPKNCEAVTRGGGDDKWRIECDGVGTRTVAGNRDINMGEVVRERGVTVDNSGHPAVKVYKRGTNITITSGELKITGSGSNKNPAILVDQQGVLTVNNVTMKDVYKGIVAEGKGSIVTVNQGKITIRSGGDSVIEVKNGGEVMLGRGVTVNGGGGAKSTGIVVGNGGGNVTLMTKNFTGVNKGIVFKEMGSGQAANVTGVGAGTMMTVERDGVGITMEGAGVTANASVMSMKITGSGAATGVDMKNGTKGTLTLMNVEMTGFDKGMNMTGGTLEVNGRSRIEGTTMGAQVSDGMLTVNGNSTIQVTTGTGLSVTGGGTANVMGGIIMAQGGGGKTGVLMEGEKTVTLSGVTVSNFATGISVTSGEVRVSGESKIIGTTMGVEVKGGKFVASMGEGGKIEVEAGTGLSVTGAGIANVMGTTITGKGGTGTGKTGVEVNTSGREGVTLTNVGIEKFETGISVTSGTVTVTRGSIIQVEADGVGLKVEKTGTATVMNSAITGNGGAGGKTGVLMESSGTVTLTEVKIEKFETGVDMTSGEVRVNGGSVIQGKSVGVEVKGGTFMMGGGIGDCG